MSAFDDEEKQEESAAAAPLLPHYMLSQTLPFHSATVRTVAALSIPDFTPYPIYLTGSLDRSCKLYKRESSVYEFDKDVALHQGYVYYVAPRAQPGDNPGFLTAGQDSRAYAIDWQGNPVACFEKGHEGPISFVQQHPLLGMVVTGGWDGTAALWDFETQSVVHKFQGHTYAVTGCCLGTGLIVTGAQDQTIKFWDPSSGKCEREIQKAHGHIIREFAPLTSGGFLSCSNDETIKRWTEDGALIREYHGHQGFVFSVCQGPGATFITGSEDRTARIWDLESGNVEQIIHHPATVWNVRVDPISNDLLTASEDYKFRIMTRDSARVADEKDLKEFTESGDQAVMGAQAMDVSSLPMAKDMARHPGSKDGQIKVFNNNGTPCAYQWEASKRNWKLIGQVVNPQGAGSSDGIGVAGKQYEGDKYFQAGQYDHIFDVDIGNNIYKRLPFNDGANPLEAAEKFAMREHLHKNVIEQIIRFINENSKKTPNPFRSKLSKPAGPVAAAKKLPMKQCVFYETVKVEAPVTKLLQFNEEMDGYYQLAGLELDQYLKTLQEMLKNEAFWYKSKFTDHHVALLKKLLHWPLAKRFPGLDLFRIAVLHPDGQKFFKVVEHGIERLAELLSVLEEPGAPDPAVMLALQVLANMFKWAAGEFVLRRKRERVLSVVANWLTAKNKNIRKAAATVCLNYSVVLLIEKQQREEGLFQLLTAVAPAMQVSVSAGDWATVHRLLTAAGNVLASGEGGTTNAEAVAVAQGMGLKVEVPASEKAAKEIAEDVALLLG